MTHILIPISYVEAAIKAKKAEIICSEQHDDKIRAAIETFELKILQDLLDTSKQISLDEKDIRIKDSTIDKHISKVFSDWTPNYREPFKAGYKQALKDLL